MDLVRVERHNFAGIIVQQRNHLSSFGHLHRGSLIVRDTREDDAQGMATHSGPFLGAGALHNTLTWMTRTSTWISSSGHSGTRRSSSERASRWPPGPVNPFAGSLHRKSCRAHDTTRYDTKRICSIRGHLKALSEEQVWLMSRQLWQLCATRNTNTAANAPPIQHLQVHLRTCQLVATNYCNRLRDEHIDSTREHLAPGSATKA